MEHSLLGAVLRVPCSPRDRNGPAACPTVPSAHQLMGSPHGELSTLKGIVQQCRVATAASDMGWHPTQAVGSSREGEGSGALAAAGPLWTGPLPSKGHLDCGLPQTPPRSWTPQLSPPGNKMQELEPQSGPRSRAATSPPWTSRPDPLPCGLPSAKQDEAQPVASGGSWGETDASGPLAWVDTGPHRDQRTGRGLAHRAQHSPGIGQLRALHKIQAFFLLDVFRDP